MAHREGIREYLKDIQVYGVVHDWGCGTKPIKNYLKPNDAKFIGIDKLSHVGADAVVNIEQTHVRFDDAADFAFCIEVLEHVWNSSHLLRNIWENLKEGGELFLSQPFMYEVHKDDDRIRYTHNGLRQLLSDCGFSIIDLHPTVGDLDHAEGYILRATK